MKYSIKTLLLLLISITLSSSCAKDDSEQDDTIVDKNCIPETVSTSESDGNTVFLKYETVFNIDDNKNFNSLLTEFFYLDESTQQFIPDGEFAISTSYENSNLKELLIDYGYGVSDKFVYDYLGENISKISYYYYYETNLSAQLFKKSRLNESQFKKKSSASKKEYELEQFMDLEYDGENKLSKIIIHEFYLDGEIIEEYIINVNVTWNNGNITNLNANDGGQTINISFSYDDKINYFQGIALSSYVNPYFSEIGFEGNIFGLPSYFSKNNFTQVKYSIDNYEEILQYNIKYTTDNIIDEVTANYLGETYVTEIMAGYMCDN